MPFFLSNLKRMKGLYSITIREPKIDDLMSEDYSYFGELNEKHNRILFTPQCFHHLPGPDAPTGSPTIRARRSSRDRFDARARDRWHWRRAARGADDGDR